MYSAGTHCLYPGEHYGNCCCNTEHASQHNKERSGVMAEGRGGERPGEQFTPTGSAIPESYSNIGAVIGAIVKQDIYS